jgi:sodium-dependent dicarboxylate transporter 2/3/5
MLRVLHALGPALFLITLVTNPHFDMSAPAWHVAGLAAWMAVWWLSAVVPLEATALLPIVILPLIDTRSLREVTASYADPIIFLFLGGFLLAATLERWGLHRRFAVATIRSVGTSAPRVMLAFMLASAVASMWVSNTATAVMMLPIAMALAGGRAEGPKGVSSADTDSPTDQRPDGFPTALMLGIAYACSIGGVATLIGTPPNAILAGSAQELLGIEITFAGWLGIGLSISIPMLLLCWLWLVILFRVRGEAPGLSEALDREKAAFGPMTGGEKFVLSVITLAALSWILRAPKTLGEVRIPGLTDLIPGLSDPMIAIAAALLMFVVPLPRSRFPTALDWKSASKVPWGILLLFGGGLALAGAFVSSGLSDWIGGRLAGLQGAPLPLVILATAAVFVFLTEMTSNTATAALGMPLMVGVGIGIGVPPLPLMAAAALAASMAFMLPVATPPNAIMFGSGMIRSRDMAAAGLGLNVIAIAITSIVVSIWAV